MRMAGVRRKKARIRAQHEQEHKQEQEQEHEQEQEQEQEQGVDRLSDLPESLIHHIFSFIDTKFAVQISVLSTRWKNLWTSLPDLNFNSQSFRRLPYFDKFVSRVLSLRDGSTIFTLKFIHRGCLKPWLLKKVIIFALSHNVQDLSINVSFYRADPSLSLIFSCPSSLKILRSITFPEFNRLTKFESLTTLHLCEVYFFDGPSTCLDFFPKCVNLKNLTLTDCSMRGLEVFHIFSPQLANLSISYNYVPYYLRHDRGFSEQCKIVVSAPKLTFLHFDARRCLELSVVNPSSLEKVELGACLKIAYRKNHLSPMPIEQKQEITTHLMKVLQGLCNAKNVTLSWNAIEVLSMVPDLSKYQPPLSGDLKTLKLKCEKSTVPDNVMTYLQNCYPNATMSMEFY